jgi:hypothetical protein
MAIKGLPVISEEEYSAPVVGSSSAQLPQWLIPRLVERKWQHDRSEQAVLAVYFIDGRRGPQAPYPQIEGQAAVAELPVAATARLPIDRLLFSRDTLRLSVEVAYTNDEWSREYVRQVLSRAATRKVPLGTGFAEDPKAVLDIGKALVRATWWSEAVTVPGARRLGIASPAEEFLTLQTGSA